MSSNEHPDMSGNPADEPLRCCRCDESLAENAIFGVAGDDESLYCEQCAADEEDERHGEL